MAKEKKGNSGQKPKVEDGSKIQLTLAEQQTVGFIEGRKAELAKQLQDLEVLHQLVSRMVTERVNREEGAKEA